MPTTQMRVPQGTFRAALDLFFRSLGAAPDAVSQDERISFIVLINATAPSFDTFAAVAFQDLKNCSISGFIRLCSEVVIQGIKERAN